MNIDFIQPLVEAWTRMVQDLFKPFRAGRWFAVGFAAWLASLSSGGGGGGNINIPGGGNKDLSEQQARIFEQVKEFLSGPIGVSLIVGFVLGVLLLIVVFLWLGSRAQFVFLDQVTGRHWRIADPWQRYATQGNSLFFWKIGFTFALLGIMLVLLGPAVAYIVISRPDSFSLAVALCVAWIFFVILFVVIPSIYVQCFLHAFVVPIMYREGRRTNDAWRRFLPLLRAHIGTFLLYGLFVFAAMVGVAVLMFTISCATCCVGFCLLALPYLGTVLALPIPYTFRGLGPSFLAQFGPEWWTWPDSGPPAPPVIEAPASPA
jgi:hypothetical protein